MPKAGDLSICLNCGWVLIYGPGLVLRLAGAEDYARVDPEDAIKIAISIDLIEQRGRFYP